MCEFVASANPKNRSVRQFIHSSQIIVVGIHSPFAVVDSNKKNNGDEQQRTHAQGLERDQIDEQADREAGYRARKRPAQQPDRHHDQRRDVGVDTGAPVSPDYGSHGNAFNGRVKGVQLAIAEAAENSDHLVSPEEAIRIAMARQ